MLRTKLITPKSRKRPNREDISAARLITVPDCAALNIALNTTAKKTAISITASSVWSSGMSVHPADICLSASNRVLRSRRRFSTAILKGTAPTIGSVPSPYLRREDLHLTEWLNAGHRSLTACQALNESRKFRASLCGRGLAWSMISACHYSVQQNADDPGGCPRAAREFKSRRPHQILAPSRYQSYDQSEDLIMPPSIGIIAPLM